MCKSSKIINSLIAILAILCLSYCQKLSDEELDDQDTKSNNQVNEVNIKARAASNSDIEFPLYAYVFKENGNFHSYAKINSSDDSLKITVGKGNFKIVTLAGCGDDYSIIEKPNINDVIKIKDESRIHSKKSLMMGVSDITVGNKNLNVELNMAYCVSSIKIELRGIPLNTKKVKFVMSPLYSSINYKGEYQKNNNGDELKLDCYLGIDGVWKAGPVYVFPGCGSTSTFKIILERENSTNSYFYLYDGTAKASQPFVIKGNFVGEVTINGQLLINGWQDEQIAEFEFDSSSGSEPEKENNNDNNDDVTQEPVSGETPQVGEIWNGCIVVKSQEEQGGLKLLLLSLKEWQCKYPEADNIMASYSVNGITGWRLPTWEEATYMKNNFSDARLDELNRKIQRIGGTPIYGDTSTRFLCFNKDNIISSFRFASNSDIRKTSDTSRVFYLRLVKLYSYKK